jgi:SMI1 / KNR4 family (SUKH-1)
MRFRDNNRWGHLSEDVVRAFETRHQISLPADYRSFLLAHHGGVPEPNFYWVVPEDWGSGICNLYGFGDPDYNLDEYYDARISFGVPDELLPIGDDGCCNFLCLAVRGPTRGNVFYLDHEYRPGEPEKVRRLSASFTEFINSLSESPDP